MSFYVILMFFLKLEMAYKKVWLAVLAIVQFSVVSCNEVYAYTSGEIRKPNDNGLLVAYGKF